MQVPPDADADLKKQGTGSREQGIGKTTARLNAGLLCLVRRLTGRIDEGPKSGDT
jgi:hypothetical protein